MKYLIQIGLIVLILSSCKLFDFCDDDEKIKPFDYNLGDTFELKANSSIVLRDSINNKYYTLWFSGPVIDERTPMINCDPNTSSGPYLTSAITNLKLINENTDIFDIAVEMVGCVQGASEEQVVKFDNDSLVFTIEQLIPYPELFNDSIKFEDYALTLITNKELQNHVLVGSYSGIMGFDTTWIEFDIVFEDSMYYGDYPDTLGSCCYGTYKRAKDYLLFTNDCCYFYDGLDEFRQIWALRGLYKYEFDEVNLHIWCEDCWFWCGHEYFLTKN